MQKDSFVLAFGLAQGDGFVEPSADELWTVPFKTGSGRMSMAEPFWISYFCDPHFTSLLYGIPSILSNETMQLTDFRITISLVLRQDRHREVTACTPKF
jgi:hypothetical protein